MILYLKRMAVLCLACIGIENVCAMDQRRTNYSEISEDSMIYSELPEAALAERPLYTESELDRITGLGSSLMVRGSSSSESDDDNGSMPSTPVLKEKKDSLTQFHVKNSKKLDQSTETLELSGGEIVQINKKFHKNLEELNIEFHQAIKKNQLRKAKALLRAGAKIDSFNMDGDTALMYAVKKPEMALVKFLLEQGANINKQSKNGSTALASAAQWGHAALVPLLLKNGADPNIADQHGTTPLMVAAFAKDGIKIAQMLIYHGAKISVANNKGQNAIDFANMFRKPELAKYLEHKLEEQQQKQ